MTPFPTSILILVAIAGAVCVLAMLQVLACVMKHEVTLHDLRNRVERINNDYAVHLARQCGDIPAEFEAVPVDEIPGQPECEAKSTPEPTIEPEPAAAPPAEQSPVQAA